MSLINRQASLLSPKTTGVTGSLLQDKPEDAVEPDPLQIQAVAPQVPQVEQPAGQEVPQEVPHPATTQELPTEQQEFESSLDVNLEALLQAEEDAKARKITKADKMDANLEALEKGHPTVDLDEEDEDYATMAEDTFWAGTRGVDQGIAWMLDLVPTGVAQGLELIDDHLLDDKLDFSDYMNVVQKTLDNRWGTVDSYKTNAVAEVAADVGQAVPMTVLVGGALGRYGLNQISSGGGLNQYAAPYALQLGKSLGIDLAAITAGETMEEIVEMSAGEDSGGALAANIGTAILTGGRLQSKFQSNTSLQKTADEVGTKIGMSDEVAADMSDSGPVMKARELAISFLEKNPISKAVFKDFSQATGNFADYNKELKLLGRSGKKYIKELWNTGLDDSQRAQFLANMEMASRLGLKLTPYELMGHEGLRPLALATAKITPEATLKRIDHNLGVLDNLLAKDSPEISEVMRDSLKKALGNHNKDIDETVEVIRNNLKQRKSDILEDIKKAEEAVSPVVIGKNFQKAVTEYVDSTKAIFGQQFDEAVDGSMMIQPKRFSSNLVESLRGLSTGTFTLPAKAGKLVNNLMEAATPTKGPNGTMVYQKVAVKDLMNARASLNKGLAQLNVNDPMFQKNRQALFDAVDAIDTTLSQVLPKESKDALDAAKKAWGENVGAKFGSKETMKLTTRDSFNQPFYNGQEMLEVLFSGADKETKAQAYADFLSLRAKAFDKFEMEDTMKIANAAADAKLHIKQYVVNQMISDIATKPNASVEDVVQGFMQRHSGPLSDLLDGMDFDPGKIIRDVQKGVEDLQKAEMDILARRLNLGASDELFDLKSYLNKTVLENESEADRLVNLLNNPSKLAELGYDKTAVQEMFSSTIMRDLVGSDVNGRALDTNIRKLLEKSPGKLEKLLGEERVDHMRKFLVGHKLSTRIKPSDVHGNQVANLDQNVAEDLGLGMIPSFVSDRLVIAKRIASAHYVHTMRAIRIIGGLSSNGYKKFMTKVMSDPEFFLDVIKFKPRNHDDVKRIRLYLAAQGIDTSVKTNKEVEEQRMILEQANAEVEGSQYDNEESLQAVVDDTLGIQEDPEAPYGFREDGTPKSSGYFGELQRPDGGVSTELSFSFTNEDTGEEVFAPYLVPTLEPQEVEELLRLPEGQQPSREIFNKAADHALSRIEQGKSPFWEQGDPMKEHKVEEPAVDLKAEMDKLTPEERLELLRIYQGGTPDIKTLLDSLTPEERLELFKTYGNTGNES